MTVINDVRRQGYLLGSLPSLYWCILLMMRMFSVINSWFCRFSFTIVIQSKFWTEEAFWGQNFFKKNLLTIPVDARILLWINSLSVFYTYAKWKVDVHNYSLSSPAYLINPWCDEQLQPYLVDSACSSHPVDHSDHWVSFFLNGHFPVSQMLSARRWNFLTLQPLH